MTAWTAEGRGLPSALQARITAESIPGAAVATVVDGVVTVATAGVTGQVGGQSVGPDTVFDAASLSKAVAACLPLQLVDAGQLALGHAASRSAVVLLAHSNRSLRQMDTAADPVLPGPHPAFAWLRACVTK